MIDTIKIWIGSLLEDWLLIKDKTCCACKHFSYFHGSVGICTVKDGCSCNNMKDCLDFCDCGQFKKRKKKK